MCTNTTFLWSCGHKTDRTQHPNAKSFTQCPEAKAISKDHTCEQIKEQEVGIEEKLTVPRPANVEQQNEVLDVVQAGSRSAEMKFMGKTKKSQSGMDEDGPVASSVETNDEESNVFERQVELRL
nr:hypothetical protein CFP56_07964 [Quercus suber]